MSGKKRLNTDIGIDIFQRFKANCAFNKKTMTEVVTDLVVKYIEVGDNIFYGDKDEKESK